MTVNVHSGPGTSAYASTRYTATVNGATSYVYGLTRTTGLPSTAWANGASVEMSWVKLTANETVTVAITRLAGAITSATVYPKNVATQSIEAGVLVLSVPTNTRLRVEINGDRANVVHVFSEPLPRAIGTTTDYSSSLPKSVSSVSGTTVTMGAAHGWSAGQRVVWKTSGTLPTVSTSPALSVHEALYVRSPSGSTLELERTPGGGAITFTGSGTGVHSLTRSDWTTGALSFGTGVHTIGRGFKLSAGTRVYIAANAVVIGSFDWRGVTGTGPIIEGPGTLLGDFATSESVQALSTFAEKITYSMFLGYDGLQFNYDTEVQGITIARAPFYTDFVAVNRYRNVQAISPWFYECNGLQVCGKSDAERTGSIVDCFSFSGDDNLTLGEQVVAFAVGVSGCFLVTTANSNIHLNYWSQPDYGYGNTFDDIDFLHLGIKDNPGNSPYPVYGGNCHIKCWSDGYVGQEQDGRFNCTFTNLRMWGPHESRWLMLANRDYPFDDYDDAQTRDLRGQIANFSFDGVDVEEAPGQLSVITGFDWLNTPHDISFKSVTIEGVGLTAANFDTYFTWNVYPYFLSVEGQPVVTAVELCNRALAYIGESPFITSISPPDESKEAKLCAKFYTQAVNEVLQGYAWGFATKRAALVEVADAGNDSYAYCYELPAGLLQVIEVMPEGAQDGYTDANGDPVRYTIEYGTETTKRLWSNLGNAWIRYTVYVTNPNEFDPFAQEAIVMLLAAKLAASIMQGKEGQATMLQYLQLAQGHINRARASDGNQRINRPKQNVVWTAGREG